MEPLQIRFNKTLVKELQKTLDMKNPMRVPKLTRVVVNMGVKDAVADKKLIDKMGVALGQITGQKPRVTKAKKSIASFKLRQGDPIGLMVTLRGKRMYGFVDKLIAVVLPRIKDFRGISRTSFDGRGNYALGFSEYAVFPEINPDTVERMQGFEIVFVTTARTNEEGLALLTAFGMPFVKEEEKKKQE